jgi:hypothetical protein
MDLNISILVWPEEEKNMKNCIKVKAVQHDTEIHNR